MIGQELEIEGCLLVRNALPDAYRGVDRDPFDALVLEDKTDPAMTPVNDAIWTLYPAGWRRDAYRLFEEDRVHSSCCDLPLFRSMDVAARCRDSIPTAEGDYEMVACRVLDLSSEGERTTLGSLLGYDAVYPGGDCYSAVKNGLHLNPHPGLRQEFGPLLNRFGLFGTTEPVGRFIKRFRAVVPSEEASEFVVVELWKPQP